MSMMASHILKFVDLSKTQKFKYLANETLFFQIKKIIMHEGQKINFLVLVTFNPFHATGLFL